MSTRVVDLTEEPDPGLTGAVATRPEAPEQPSPQGSPTLRTEDYKYNPAKDREEARRNIAYWLLVILTAVIIGLTVAAVMQVADLNQLVTVFLTPIVGLVGTVLGFYFGGDKN